MDCIFCKIANKEIPSEIVYEDEETLGFKNIEPEAPVHLLIIPKKHVEWKEEMVANEVEFFGKLISTAKRIAAEQNVFQASKLIFNIGKTGHISHIHLHLIGGWDKEIPMSNVPKN